MLIKKPSDILPSEITPPAVYRARRHFLQASAALLAAPLLGSAEAAWAAQKLPAVQGPFSTTESPTPYKDVTTYNNFYEFGYDKSSPAELAKNFVTRPWSVTVDGLVKRPTTYGIEDLLRFPLQDRTYRLRCVEGWSMVIPWVGFPLNELIRRAEPLGNARFVEFVSVYDPAHMPGQREPMLAWPYTEGLRLDEAMHPLTLLTLGLYGEVLPNQNGAPVRIVVPWKYGFKSAKSLVHIRFVENQPISTWMRAAPTEYGFYSNVNPEVDHPRWSQARERRIGEFFKRKTLLFNGYGDQVASMYAGMDLKKYF